MKFDIARQPLVPAFLTLAALAAAAMWIASYAENNRSDLPRGTGDRATDAGVSTVSELFEASPAGPARPAADAGSEEDAIGDPGEGWASSASRTPEANRPSAGSGPAGRKGKATPFDRSVGRQAQTASEGAEMPVIAGSTITSHVSPASEGSRASEARRLSGVSQTSETSTPTKAKRGSGATQTSAETQTRRNSEATGNARKATDTPEIPSPEKAHETKDAKTLKARKTPGKQEARDAHKSQEGVESQQLLKAQEAKEAQVIQRPLEAPDAQSGRIPQEAQEARQLLNAQGTQEVQTPRIAQQAQETQQPLEAPDAQSRRIPQEAQEARQRQNAQETQGAQNPRIAQQAQETQRPLEAQDTQRASEPAVAAAPVIPTPGELLARFRHAHPVWSRWIAGFLILFTGLSVGRLTVRYNLYRVGTCLAIPLYAAAGGWIAAAGDYLTAFAAATLLGLAMKNYCRSFCNGYGFDAIFRASLYLGTVPLLDPATLPLLLMLPLAVLLFRRTQREAVVALAGLLLPILAFCYVNWGAGGGFTAPLVGLGDAFLAGAPLGLFVHVPIAALGLLGGLLLLDLLAIVFFLSDLYVVGTKARHILSFQIALLLLSVAVLCTPAASPGAIALVAVPSAVLLPLLFVRIHPLVALPLYLLLLASTLFGATLQYSI